jgi:hypothetical protein
VAAVHVLDELTVRAGRLDAVLARIDRDYLPGATARGMTLVGVWRTPPVELHEDASQIVVLWSLPDVSAWWAMRRAAGADTGVSAFWASIADDVVARSRRMLEALPTDAGSPP